LSGAVAGGVVASCATTVAARASTIRALYTAILRTGFLLELGSLRKWNRFLDLSPGCRAKCQYSWPAARAVG
jgi:hypothetical protein